MANQFLGFSEKEITEVPKSALGLTGMFDYRLKAKR